MFPALHEFLVDDFASIVFTSLDMNRLLHDCIRAATESTSCAVLELTGKIVSAIKMVWPGMRGRTRVIDGWMV